MTEASTAGHRTQGDAPPGRQPYLHQHLTCVRAPALWISPRHGDLLGGVDGLYVADRRVLSGLTWTVAGERLAPLTDRLLSADRASFLGVVRAAPGDGPDPAVTCERLRVAGTDGGTETFTLVNRARRTAAVDVELRVACDLAPIGEIKSGRATTPLTGEPYGQGFRWRAPDGASARLTCSAPVEADPATGRLRWRVEVPPGGRWSVEVRIRRDGGSPDQPDAAASTDDNVPAGDAPTSTVGGASTDDAASGSTTNFRPTPAHGPAPWSAEPLRLSADDHRADNLVRQGVADLDALRLVDPAAPGDSYFAAGSPWFLTLFGRDALWSALLALPLGTEMLTGTLRTLARRQGTQVDPVREEAPGKILHEVRPAGSGGSLPPVYYGTVDATPLFVIALAEAWRWGAPDAEVAALLPAARRALEWLVRYGDADGDGFVEYLPTGQGLSNQGWKDSFDGVQWADGRLADVPLALCEVQGYAYRAATEGAALLAAFDEPGAERWRDWAAGLAERFRRAYWLSDAHGRYPAIALDGAKRPVDGPASNMGHLLGTGLLSPDEEATVAERLLSPPLTGGYGLRTLADTATGFNPLSYHGGSVWPHDTAIAAVGLARAGFPDAAGRLMTRVLAAAPWFEYRLPELYGGHHLPGLPPVPYPAACRPQAWAAAVAPALVQVLLGIEPDVPAGRVVLRPPGPSPVGAFEVAGVRLAGNRLDVRVAADGSVTVLAAPDGLQVVVARDARGAQP
ncbi:MAG TPA: glycogen debranching N-terminal domain-containing protein [Micromonosporaceae bacterium]